MKKSRKSKPKNLKKNSKEQISANNKRAHQIWLKKNGPDIYKRLGQLSAKKQGKKRMRELAILGAKARWAKHKANKELSTE